MGSRRQYFSLEEANALIPLVEKYMRNVLQMHVLLRTAADALAGHGLAVSPELLSGEDVPPCPSSAHNTLARAQALYSSVRNELEKVHALGARVKDIEKGLVDFYSFRDGVEEVLLCWRIGERKISHYHDLESGFRGRKPVRGHLFLRREVAVALEGTLAGSDASSEAQ